MKKFLSLLLALGMVASLAACGGGSTKLRFVTGGESGTYYAFGSVIAQHATNNAGIDVVGLVGNGSQSNVQELQDGNAELAFCQSDVMAYAYNGTNIFADHGKVDCFSTVAALYMEQVQIVTVDPTIKTVEDLPKLGIKTFFCSNVCAAYRRDIYEELGGFIRHTIFNEDMIYAAGAVRAGYGIAYEADARVIHSHNYTNMQQLRRNFDLGVSQADHPEVFAGVPSEAEGRKLVQVTYQSLKAKKKLYLFPGFCVQCGFKYAGYLMGKHYKKLPKKWVMKITMNREYWK